MTGGGAALAGDGFNFGGIFGGASDRTAYTAEIFVASTRKGGTHSTELTPGAKARFSLDYISVPPDHRPGAIELPAIGGPNPDHHFTLSQHSQLDEDEFREQIAAHVSGRVGSNRDVLIYVHGFNTSLEEARFRLAQLVVDAKFGGVAVLFTWPSKAALLAYGAGTAVATQPWCLSVPRNGGWPAMLPVSRMRCASKPAGTLIVAPSASLSAGSMAR